MPLIPHTPESLLPRSDSKNPATTCKGLTSNGRPCRRGLASSPGVSPSQAPKQGVLAVLTEGEVDGSRAAAFFCWQHKDQAEHLVSTNNNATEVVQLKERTSIDTLVDRLGVLDLDNDATPTKGRRRKQRTDQERRHTRRDTLPEQWHDVHGPLISVPEGLLPSPPNRSDHRSQKPRPKSNVVPSMFCCLKPADDEDFPAPRRHQGHPADVIRPPHMVQVPPRSQLPAHCNIAGPRNYAQPIHRKAVSQISPRPPPHPIPSSSSHTTTLLSLIPQHLTPQTTSALLTELSKPISPADEAGYIYMFWLTPSSAPSPPSADLASNLLSQADSTGESRRASDALRSNSIAKNGTRTILLKIGRASNVHRRLTQWTRQCSHNLTLIRYYPYQPTSPSPSPASSPAPSPRGRQSLSLSPQLSNEGARRVPHAHRVERLIHLELADKKVKGMGKCDECGKEHREWFEVEASTSGLREVDGCVRRWVSWAERQVGIEEPKRREPEGYF